MRLSELVKDESIRKLVVDCKNAGFEIKNHVGDSMLQHTITCRYIISTDIPETWRASYPQAALEIYIWEDSYNVSFYIQSGYCWWDTEERILNMQPRTWPNNKIAGENFFDNVEDDDEIRSAIEKIKMIVIMNLGLLSGSKLRTEDDYQNGPTKFFIRK